MFLATQPALADSTLISLFFKQFGDQTFGLGVILIIIGALIAVARKGLIPCLQLILQISTVNKESYALQEAAAKTFQANLQETASLIRDTLTHSTEHGRILADMVRLHKGTNHDEEDSEGPGRRRSPSEPRTPR